MERTKNLEAYVLSTSRTCTEAKINFNHIGIRTRDDLAYTYTNACISGKVSAPIVTSKVTIRHRMLN